MEVAAAAQEAFSASDEAHGYRRVDRDLVEAGHLVSVDLVRRVMREADLAAVQPAAFRVTTRQDPDALAAPDLIARDFTSATPGTRLVGDITYIRTLAGWAYLAVVIDLATKMIVGWSISNRASAKLCIDALEMADRNGHLDNDAIFHTDRGCQTPRAPSVAAAQNSLCDSRWAAPASTGTHRHISPATPNKKPGQPHTPT